MTSFLNIPASGFSSTVGPRLSLLGSVSLEDLSAAEIRRQTFVQASGQGDVLSEFMAAARSSAEEEGNGMEDEEDEGLKQTFGQRFPPQATTPPASAAAVPSLNVNVNVEEETTTATAVTTVVAAPEPQSARGRITRARSTTTINPKLVSAKATVVSSATPTTRQAKLAEWKNAQAAQQVTTPRGNNENRMASTSITASSLAAAKRKTTGLSPSLVSNRVTPVSSGLVKKATTRVNVGITNKKEVAATTVAAPAVPASPRKQWEGKRKSMMTPSDLASVPESGAAPIEVPTIMAPANTEETNAWKSTAQWRLILLRLQKSSIASLQNELTLAREAQETISKELEAARQSTEEQKSQIAQMQQQVDENQMQLDASSNKEKELASQLATSVTSESMLRLAAEELNARVETLNLQLQSQQKEYEETIQQLQNEDSNKVQTISQLRGEVQTLTTSESALKAQLEETLTTLAQIKEARYADEKARKKLHAQIQDLKGSIRIFCRVRPGGVTVQSSSAMVDDEQDVTPTFSRAASTTDHGVGGALSNFTEDLFVTGPVNKTTQTKLDGSLAPAQNYNFNFDKVFLESSSQDDLYKELDDLIVSALDSTVNVSVFAYGATGSGKTHTMLGSDNQPGMIPRAIDRMFEYATSAAERKWTYNYRVSLMEIYCDEVRDLLAGYQMKNGSIVAPASGFSAKEPKISHDKAGRTVVSNVESFPVTSPAEVHVLLENGSKSRAVSATACNARSSRSHTVFQFHIEGVNTRSNEKISSIVNLVDLAGSERLDASKAGSNPTLLKETQHINSSLSSLVTCMSAIASKNAHVPFRDSKLTHLLADSLGRNGNGQGPLARTLFFVNVSPESINFNETLCTLRFAEKLKQVEMSSANAAPSKRAKKV